MKFSAVIMLDVKALLRIPQNQLTSKNFRMNVVGINGTPYILKRNSGEFFFSMGKSKSQH